MSRRCNNPNARVLAGRLSMTLAFLFSLPSAHAARTDTALVDQINRDGLLNSTVTFTDVSRAQACDAKPDASCKRHASARYVPLTATELAADQLEKAWKEFQEATYFHMTARLNAGMPFGLTGAFPNCLTRLGGGSGITPLETKPTTKVEEDDLMSDPSILFSPALKKMLPVTFEDGVQWNFTGNRRESGYFPKIPVSAFCDNPQASPAFFPPENAYPWIGTAGYQPSHFDNGFTFGPFPMPNAVNWPELAKRLQAGCNSALTTLYPAYAKKVLLALAPLGFTGATWRPSVTTLATPGQRGETLVQPVYESDPRRLPDLLTRVAEIIAKTLDPRAPQYFAMTGTFGANITSPGRAGIKSLEDAKRFFPVLPLAQQERSGTVSLFMVWPSLDIVREQRPVLYNTFSTACAGIWPARGCSLVGPLPLPAPETAMTPAGCVSAPAPGAGGLTITLPRFHYQYVNVPEGYSVPDIQGDPSVLK